MRENGLRARQKRRLERTTDSQHAWPVASNLLDQDFTATGPDEKWGADIAYVWTRKGWWYLAVVIDLGLGLTRFGGHPEAFARGAADAKNTPTVFAGISPTDGRAGPCWP